MEKLIETLISGDAQNYIVFVDVLQHRFYSFFLTRLFFNLEQIKGLLTLVMSGYSLVFVLSFKVNFLVLISLYAEIFWDIIVKKIDVFWFVVKFVISFTLFIQLGYVILYILEHRYACKSLYTFYNIARFLIPILLLIFYKFIVPNRNMLSNFKFCTVSLSLHIAVSSSLVYECYSFLDMLYSGSLGATMNIYTDSFFNFYNSEDKIHLYRTYSRVLRDAITIYMLCSLPILAFCYSITQFDNLLIFFTLKKIFILPLFAAPIIFGLYLLTMLIFPLMKGWLLIVLNPIIYYNAPIGYYPDIFFHLALAIIPMLFARMFGKNINKYVLFFFSITLVPVVFSFFSFQILKQILKYVPLEIDFLNFLSKFIFYPCMDCINWTGLYFILFVGAGFFFHILYNTLLIVQRFKKKL